MGKRRFPPQAPHVRDLRAERKRRRAWGHGLQEAATFLILIALLVVVVYWPVAAWIGGGALVLEVAAWVLKEGGK